MEFLLIILGLWAISRVARAVSASAKATGDAARHLRDHGTALAEARAALADMERDLAALRRDLRDEGGEPPIPPGAPDPLADFMARRTARRQNAG